ncbi:MAG: sensor histidine kinase N-terminal domain-containing protein [Burkholderiaceae bacterium]
MTAAPGAPAASARAPTRWSAMLDDLIATRDPAEESAWTAPPDLAGTAPAPRRAAEQRSLFGEILDWMMVPLLLLWPLSVAMTFVIARSIADGPFDRALLERTQALTRQIRMVDGRPRLDGPMPASAASATDGARLPYLQIIDALGQPAYGEANLPLPTLYDFPQIGVTKLRQDTYRGEELRIAYQYLEPPGSPPGSNPLLVQVAETPAERTRLANEIIKGVILPQFLILPMALALVWFGLGRGLRPLRVAQESLHARRIDDLSALDRRSVPQEIAPLVDGFNELLRRLDHTMSEQRRFIADAAHQLKTPLAGLHTQAELAMRETDPEDVRRSLRQLARSSGRAAHLVNQLLAMARIENLREHAALEAIDLNPLARAVVTDWVDPALQRRIDFGYESPDEPAPIAGHAILLQEMLNNLIDNALRYTPEGGTVTVRLATDAGEVRLEVEDDGPGVPAGERQLVFERFYRVLGTAADGSGLGLAIVREIVTRHGADVELHDTRPGHPARPGMRVVVRFAKAQED